MLQDKPITIFFSKRSAVKKEIRNMNVKGKAEEGRERRVRKREGGKKFRKLKGVLRGRIYKSCHCRVFVAMLE